MSARSLRNSKQEQCLIEQMRPMSNQTPDPAGVLAPGAWLSFRAEPIEVRFEQHDAASAPRRSLLHRREIAV